MPYREALDLPENPTVKIFLQGQLVLEPNNSGTQCDIGVNRTAPDHRFSMEVRQKMMDPESPDIILMRHVGPLTGGFVIDLEPASIEGVKRFIPTQDFARNDDHDPQDFRWIVDLENHEFHNGDVIFNGTGTEPNIRVRDGIFYTALRTDPEIVKVTRKGGDLADLILFRIAAMIGINIYLTAGRKFRLNGSLNGVPQALKLEKPADGSPIRNYEIWINNDPLYIDPDNAPVHPELKLFYSVVDFVKVGGEPTIDFKHFELEFDKVAEEPPLGTPRIPCMPVGGGQ